MISTEAVFSALANVLEPDLKKDIVTLGLVDNVRIEENVIRFDVQVSNPAMHNRKRMADACAFAIERVLGKDWQTEANVIALKEENRTADTRRVLPGVKHIIAVASGKGGVGKSTISANLATGLARRGLKVGLIDADIYGPSMPTMFDVTHDKPKVVEKDGKSYLEPIESYGVKLLSIGFFADINQAIVWRGPMATKALNQLFQDAWWGDLDYMILDLPPGTGDIHLTIVGLVGLTGAVIVTTPQEIALADARKGLSMFRLPSVNVPVLGVIENMSWFTPEELPDNRYYLFGRDGGKLLAEQNDVPLLGQIPIIQSLREAGDIGRPAVLQENTLASKQMDQLIDNFLKQMDKLKQSNC
jgi:ATP-binding protein involved in chromosome partitioning